MSASTLKRSNGNGSHLNGTHVNSTKTPPPSVPPEAVRHATVADIAALLGAEIVGNAQTLVTGGAGLDRAGPGAILFV
jgi:hypothetical protein